MGGLLDSVGSGLGGLYASTVGRIVDAVTGAAGQAGTLVPGDPRVIAVGVVVVAAVLYWLWRR